MASRFFFALFFEIGRGKGAFSHFAESRAGPVYRILGHRYGGFAKIGRLKACKRLRNDEAGFLEFMVLVMKYISTSVYYIARLGR